MKKRYKILIGILILLVAIRIALPFVIIEYVNKVLADIEGYTGSIDDVDLALYRGAYKIKGLELFQVDGDHKVPFLDFPLIDLSLEWSALVKGAIEGKIIFENAIINFVDTESEGETQTGEDVDWTGPIKELMPLSINRLEVINSKVVFHNFTSEPPVNLELNNLNLVATNLNNADDNDEKLPSHVSLNSNSFGGGQLAVEMDINILKEVPDLDLDLQFEGVDMTSLNEFLWAYAKFDVDKGDFNVYSELIINEGQIEGYVKPVITDMKILNLKEDGKDKPLNAAYQAVIGMFKDIFKNQREDQFATKVPLEGNLNSVNTPLLPTIGGILRNAFIEAFTNSTDNTVEFDKVIESKDPE